MDIDMADAESVEPLILDQGHDLFMESDWSLR